MMNGVQVLGSIDGAIQRASSEVAAVDQEIASLTERLVALRQAQSETYRDLARLRLGDLAGGDIVQGLSAAERQARDLLEKRREAQGAIETKLSELEQELARLSEQRESFAETLERERQALEEAQQAVLDSLAETADYRAQLAETEKTEAIARHAEQKTAFAKEDRAEKGKPYEDDPLFVYLWERGWGTSRYGGGPIARFFDAKVAHLIDYDRARPNYAMLLEIPKRLAEHAERQRALAEQEAERLEKLEDDALAQSDAQKRAGTVAEAEGQLESVDDRIEEAQQRRNEVVSERAELTSGQDAQTKQALEVVLAALQRQDLRTLRRQAERTPTPEDDTVVDRAQDIELEIREAQDLLKEREAMRDQKRRRLQEAEELRRDYRRQGGGRDMFDFQDSSMLSILLTEMLAGALSRDGLWDQINRRRRPRMPGGWDGGLGMPRRRGGFGGGLGGGFGGGFGGRASRSGGGTRTGGGFRGKGFRTGGMF